MGVAIEIRYSQGNERIGVAHSMSLIMETNPVPREAALLKSIPAEAPGVIPGLTRNATTVL